MNPHFSFIWSFQQGNVIVSDTFYLVLIHCFFNCSLLYMMDLETENKIAAVLLKEAAELRKKAEREGVQVYLQQPKMRGRPNSRFLTATILGIQQANRTVEVNEMWRIRQEELELDNKLNGRSNYSNDNCKNMGVDRIPSCSRQYAYNGTSTSSSAKEREFKNCNSIEDTGLRDEDVEEFLHSRVKRGRGAVGSRMDETGPYLHSFPDSEENIYADLDVRENRVVYGPEKPPGLNSREFSDEELDENRRKKLKKARSGSSNKKNSKKHRSEENSKDRKSKRKEKKRRKY
ncbi:hypothetical protein K2173_007663 [Erythroxylum novogranatense]|uniref:Uncharacterized protein n=1 Tax=Erythroxylum novogranatense TaxID=1862640 RepID=A0AAV8TVN7_9ROSI|nr:hypothetical protein K2173_007663 [Erythroxylum novogranatense]